MRRDFTQLAEQHFDVLICGGGIYGAWTAYDATLRGLKVAIIDQGDWANGTSSASSKLIHGGLRYLETLDFSLVKKSLLERQMLLKAAPHRVWPLRFGVPVNKRSRIGSLRLKIGLSLYDMLADTSQNQNHRRYNRSEFAAQFPNMETSSLRCGYTYMDAQTDDARLVLELIDGAISAGATAVNYCQATNYIEKNQHLCGVEIKDLETNTNAVVHTRYAVNTIGQWTLASRHQQNWCRLSKGVHLALPKVLDKEALLLTAQSDGRVFFIMPWYGVTLVGTTDTDYQGDINQVQILPEDVDYLLHEANRALGTSQWTRNDILGQFSGLRVMQHSKHSSPSDVSRDWKLKSLNNGLFYSVGGKITSAREDSAIIVDTVCQQLNIGQTCQTYAKPFPWLPEEDYAVWKEQTSAKAKQLGIDDESAKWLIRRHGKRITEIFQSIEQHSTLAERITPALPFIMADLIFCMRNEMVIHLEDVLRRRLPLLILSRMTRIELQYFAGIAAEILNWDEIKKNDEISYCSKKWLEN